MADDFDNPITAAELEVVSAAHALLQKTARMAHEFLSSLPQRGDWTKAEFPTSESKVVAIIAQQFRQHRRLVTHSKRYPWVSFGLTFDPRPHLELWIEFRPTDFEARDAVFAAAKAGELPETWYMRPEGWASLGTRTPVEAELDQEFALRWLTDRFAELDQAGLFAELPKWRRRNRAGDTESDGDDDGP